MGASHTKIHVPQGAPQMSASQIKNSFKSAGIKLQNQLPLLCEIQSQEPGGGREGGEGGQWLDGFLFLVI